MFIQSVIVWYETNFFNLMYQIFSPRKPLAHPKQCDFLLSETKLKPARWLNKSFTIIVYVCQFNADLKFFLPLNCWTDYHSHKVCFKVYKHVFIKLWLILCYLSFQQITTMDLYHVIRYYRYKIHMHAYRLYKENASL